MRSPRSTAVLCLCLALGVLGSSRATAQYVQGTDQSGTAFTNPANWSRTIIDKTALVDNEISFLLNPCEYAIYKDTAGRFRTCMPRPACDFLEDMGDTLESALLWWEDLADPEDALDFEYGGVLNGLVGIDCPATALDCPAADGWTDDTNWVVTRTYQAELDEEDCPDADTGALGGAGGLKFYTDPAPPADPAIRWIRECDIVFPARKWDNEIPEQCPGNAIPPIYTFQECAGAWLLELVHEVGHCLGFSHAYLTRKTLQPLESTMDGLGVGLVDGANSIMTYDRPGQVQVFNNGHLYPYDEALYLHTYSVDPDPTPSEFFAAYGTVVSDGADNDCASVATPELLFGAGVIALQEMSAGVYRPVQMSFTGVDPLDPGEFRLEHLDRNETYRIIVVDARDMNQINPNGWDFEDVEGGLPGWDVHRTDVWSELNSGNGYTYEIPARFDTGFDFVLRADFDWVSGDYNEGQICVEFQ